MGGTITPTYDIRMPTVSGMLAPMARLWPAQDEAAEEPLDRDPLALLTAMLLDQRVAS